MNDEDIVKFQIYQDKLCVSFNRFHASLESVLERPVYTHELGFTNIKDEYEGKRGKPTIEEILGLISKEYIKIIGDMKHAIK